MAAELELCVCASLDAPKNPGSGFNYRRKPTKPLFGPLLLDFRLSSWNEFHLSVHVVHLSSWSGIGPKKAPKSGWDFFIRQSASPTKERTRCFFVKRALDHRKEKMDRRKNSFRFSDGFPESVTFGIGIHSFWYTETVFLQFNGAQTVAWNRIASVKRSLEIALSNRRNLELQIAHRRCVCNFWSANTGNSGFSCFFFVPFLPFIPLVPQFIFDIWILVSLLDFVWGRNPMDIQGVLRSPKSVHKKQPTDSSFGIRCLFPWTFLISKKPFCMS